MNGRVDSAVDITSHLLNELRANKGEDEDISRYLFSREELHLLMAFAIVMDYLNYGNSVDQVERICARATQWCVDYYGRGYHTNNTPKHVLRVHPNLYELSIPSYERLDSQPPPLDPDTSENSTSDFLDEVSELSTDDDADEADTRSTVSDLVSDVGIRLRDGAEVAAEGEIRRERFPAYAEPVLIQDADLYRILDVYDELGVSIERRRSAEAMQHDNMERHMSIEYYPVEEHAYGRPSIGRAQGSDEIRIRGMDLVESPIIFYLPSVVYGIACLNLRPVYRRRMVCFGKEKLDAYKAALKDTEQEQAPQLLRQRQRQEQRPVPPVPPQGYRQPNVVVPLPRQQPVCNGAPCNVYHHPVVVAPPTGYRKLATVEPVSQQHPSAGLAAPPGHQKLTAAGPVPQQYQPLLASVAPPHPFGFLPPLQQQQTLGSVSPPRPRQQVYINQHPRYQPQEFRAPPPQREDEEQSFFPVQYTGASSVTSGVVAATVKGATKRGRMEDSDLYPRTPSPERKRSRGRWRFFSLLSGSGKKRRKERSSPLIEVQINFWKRFRSS